MWPDLHSHLYIVSTIERVIWNSITVSLVIIEKKMLKYINP